MLRYHVAFYLPEAPGEMVVAEALDFPGAVTQGFDLPDARLMISSAMEDLAQCLLEDGKPLPAPNPDAAAAAPAADAAAPTARTQCRCSRTPCATRPAGLGSARLW